MRKFIITSDGQFKYGDVRMHKDLLTFWEDCWGGGYYEFDYVSNRLLLSGASFDFGEPKWHYLDALKVPEYLRGFTLFYHEKEIDLPIVYV